MNNYSISKTIIFSTKLVGSICLLISFTAFIVGFYIPIESGVDALMAFSPAIVFLFLTIGCFVNLKNALNANVSSDLDGLWQQKKGKQIGLIKWCQIRKIKYHRIRQCMDLYDSNGLRVLRIDYQLSEFVHLRHKLLTSITLQESEYNLRRFNKNFLYHVFYICVFVTLLLSIFVFIDIEYIFSILTFFLLGYLGYRYLTEIIGIELENDSLIIKCPFRSVRLERSEIRDVRIGDDSYRQNIYPMVLIVTNINYKPIEIKELDYAPHIIMLALIKYFDLDI